MDTQPKYPIYIISKGRADSRLTSKTLEEINVPYRIVIEESEYDAYAAVINPKKILTLPPGFRENPLYAHPDTEGRVGGSIPARNFVWEHSINKGHARHWIMDDNMRYFYRLNRNKKRPVTTGAVIRAVEDFTDRYTNVKQAGMNYAFFCPSDIKRPPYYLNTRIYSCILNSNDITHRWRGKYNEDTDLSIRILKDDWCTFLFNFALCGKAATHSMKGGNTEEVYNVGNKDNFDNRREFADSLVAQHPDIVKVTQKWGRWHHQVDYTKFIQKPIKKDGLNIRKGNNEYGMKLNRITEEQYSKVFFNNVRGKNGSE
jgi:hypothetical protein